MLQQHAVIVDITLAQHKKYSNVAITSKLLYQHVT